MPTAYLASYDVFPVSEEEVRSPEEIDQGGPGDVSEYLRHQSEGEEKNLKIFFTRSDEITQGLTCSQEIVTEPHV